MRIGHFQLESQCGDFDHNLGRVVESLARADREHIDIVCFPECFLTGYPNQEEVGQLRGMPSFSRLRTLSCHS